MATVLDKLRDEFCNPEPDPKEGDMESAQPLILEFPYDDLAEFYQVALSELDLKTPF